jgi:hypothetical protein
VAESLEENARGAAEMRGCPIAVTVAAGRAE